MSDTVKDVCWQQFKSCIIETMECHGNQFHHHTTSQGKKPDGNGSRQTDSSKTGQDLNDDNRKRSTHSGYSCLSQTGNTSNTTITSQFSKKRKIRMGPQECVEYSSTSQGASPLTNPQCNVKTSKDVNEKLYPVQRGRSQGSCFIPAHKESQVSMGRKDLQAPSSMRQYVSPSKGAGMKAANQGPIYDSSGLAHIGSPKQKNAKTGNQFGLNSPKSLAGKPGPALNESVTNNWRKSTNVWKKTTKSSLPTQSPPVNHKFMSQPNTKVFSSQRNVVNDKPFSPSGKTFSQGNYQNQFRSTIQYATSPNKWKKRSGSAGVSSPTKSTDASFLRSPTSKMQFSPPESQNFSQHFTQQQPQYPPKSMNFSQHSNQQQPQYPPKSQNFSQPVTQQQPQYPPKSMNFSQHSTQQQPKYPPKSQNFSQHSTQQQSQFRKQNISQAGMSFPDNSVKKHSVSPPSQFHAVQQTVGSNVPNQSAQAAKKFSTSPGRQTLMTEFYKKTPPKETGPDCNPGADFDTNKSIKRDLNHSWGADLNLVKSSVKHSNQQISFQGVVPGSLQVKTAQDDENIRSGPLIPSPWKMDPGVSLKVEDEESDRVEPSSSQNSSTGSCNLNTLSILSQGETEKQADVDLDYMMEAEALPQSQPSTSSQTTTNFGEEPEDDCIEELLKDYEIDERGNLRLSQSSSGLSGDVTNSGEKTDGRDFDDEDDDSLDESQSLLKGLLGNDDDKESTATLLQPKEEHEASTSQSQSEKCLTMENQSVCTSEKKLLGKSTKPMEIPLRGLSASSNNLYSGTKHMEGYQTEKDFASSSGSVSKLGSKSTLKGSLDSSQSSTELGASCSQTGVEFSFGDMPDEEEIPEELLEQIEAGNIVDNVSLKDRTFGLVGNGTEEEGEVEEENMDYFSALPVEVMENIFSRIPVIDLLQSCSIVCHKWANVISNDSFIPWKKSYSRCKAGHGNWTSPLKDTTKESCLLDVIRFLSTLSRKPSESTLTDLKRHSSYEFAKDLIAENLPELCKDGSPHPWSTVAALVVVAETVEDVQEIFRCLLHPSSRNTPTAVTEVMYCIATLLLFLQKRYNLCRRLHFRVFYALFLYESGTKLSTSQLEEVGVTGQQRRTNPHSIAGKFPLTDEQLRIVNHKLNCGKNEVIKVVAFAGTGKTTTLIKFAEANIYRHLLYVAFNKSVQVEACKVFPGNTECRTSHSLAYEKVKHKYGNKLTFDLKPHMINDLIPKRPQGEKSPLQWALYARLVGDTIKSFMASADEFITTKHVPEQYSTGSSSPRPLTHHDRMLLLKDAEYLWARMIDENDRDAGITHDGYFKVYQLSKPVITDVQCLLIDEAQDLTPAQQDVLLNQPLPKILVGDPHQQIYSFRGARNAMDTIQADKVYHLTQSFRFGSEIAYMANCILDVYKQMANYTIVGKEEDGTLCGDEIGQKVIICRGNTTVFSQAVKLCEMEGHENLRLGFTGFGEGHYCKSGFNFEKLMDLYKMSTGASGGSLQNKFFRKMATFGNLEVYAHNAEDSELLALISIVKLYNHRIPELIETIKSKTARELQFATVVLTTAHKSKGLEFDTVQIADDFKMFGARSNLGEEGIVITDDCNIPEDEKNLIYVAVTRAKKSLRLNEGLRKCLGKASEQFKFPIPTKQFLECPHSVEEQRCLDCGVPITEMKRVAMSKVWSVKLVGSPQHATHPTNSGGFICSSCSYHHLPGFEKIFLGDRNAPRAASIT